MHRVVGEDAEPGAEVGRAVMAGAVVAGAAGAGAGDEEAQAATYRQQRGHESTGHGRFSGGGEGVGERLWTVRRGTGEGFRTLALGRCRSPCSSPGRGVQPTRRMGTSDATKMGSTSQG